MSRHVAVVRAEGVNGAVRRLKAEHRGEMARHPHVMRFLHDHMPAIHAKVAACRNRPRVAQDVVRWDRYKVRLYGCHVEPWCVACTNEAKWRRVAAAIDAFHACTPAGKQPRFAHVVMTAPIFDDGKGWGRFARENLKAFRDITWKTTKAAFGPGIGGLLSYQDFGEKPFLKGHPHMDYTINGWTLEASEPTKTPEYTLKGGGHQKWVHRVQAAVAARWLLPPNEGTTNFRIQPFVTGVPEYVGVLAYQLRELVDVRKLEYDRTRQLVYWKSYRDNTRTKLTVPEFFEGLRDYQRRLGEWGRHQAASLHVATGHMARRTIGITATAMGSEERNHRRGCHCGDCTEWELVTPQEDGTYDFDPWASTPG
ncbi:MAG: hypothetical protein LC620_00380 [Halobacteriales archaeon]|nr:hypothetical protein [Halobacteriales archaeon]